MTVKEIFELRKQGRIEEAYEAIRPMYAAHKGRYTTLCMFWTAADVFKLRLDQKRYDEAEKILEALKRMLPRVEEINKELDGERPTSNPTDKPAENSKPLPWEKGDAKTADDQNKAAAFIASATRRLAKITSSRAASDTVKKSTRFSSPAPGIPAAGGKNLQDLQDFCPQGKENKTPSRAASDTAKKTTRLSPASHPKRQLLKESNLQDLPDLASNSEQATKESPQGKDTPTNSQLLHDYPGHLIVSLDEGIIRPIEGINAPQRVVLACITAHPGYSVPQISASTGIPAKSIERHVSALIEKNLIAHRGSKKTGGYYAK